MDIKSTQSDVDIAFIHKFLSTKSRWAKGIDYATVEKSINNSLCFSGFIDNRQVAFARVISDFATFANLVDVFVLEEHRGNGYSKQLIEYVMRHPDLQSLRRFTLVTSNAHRLYHQFGFTRLANPDSHLECYYPAIYSSKS